MPSDAGLVFFLIGLAAVLMASNRVRYDLIALIVLIALALTGVLSPAEAVSGFGATIVIMVAGLFVVGEMLDRTGVARAAGDLILAVGRGREVRLMAPLAVGAALLGSVMSSTAVVAIFIPVVMRIARDTGINPARLLMPMAFGALISGMLTLIGTPGNIAVSDALREGTGQGLGFFSFTGVGVLVLLGMVIFFAVAGRFLLGPQRGTGPEETRRADRSFADLSRLHGLERVEVMRLTRPFAGAAAEALEAAAPRILARRRRGPGGGARAALYAPGMDFQRGDLVVVAGGEEALAAFAARDGILRIGFLQDHMDAWIDTLGVLDVMVHPEAGLRGRRLDDLDFRGRYGLEVLNVLRDGDSLPEMKTEPLRAGDRLLVAGDWARLDAINAAGRDFVVIEEPAERARSVPQSNMLLAALAILFGMIALSLAGLSVTVAVLLAAVAAVVTGTVTPVQAYRAVRLETLVLIAGMLPLAQALDRTGGADMIVRALLDVAGDDSPRAVMFALFFMTMSLSWILSNTATLVLAAPIAVEAALAMGVSPVPMAVAVLIAGSAGFASPVSSPVVTLVVGPGGYRFAHFLKCGLPMTLWVALVTLLAIPAVFPF